MISKMKEITNLQIRQNGQQRKVWQTAKKNLVVLGNSLTVHLHVHPITTEHNSL